MTNILVTGGAGYIGSHTEGFALLRAYNLGTGQGASVAEVIEAARAVTGRDICVLKGGRRSGDPDVLLADPALARSHLVWTPRYRAIADIIETAWGWSSRVSQHLAPLDVVAS